MFRGCRDPSGYRHTALPSRLVALPLSALQVLGFPPGLPTSLCDMEVESAGGDVPSLDSMELEMWLGELTMMTEEGLSWPGLASKLDHWTTAPGVGVGEGPASIHMTCLSR